MIGRKRARGHERVDGMLTSVARGNRPLSSTYAQRVRNEHIYMVDFLNCVGAQPSVLLTRWQWRARVYSATRRCDGK